MHEFLWIYTADFKRLAGIPKKLVRKIFTQKNDQKNAHLNNSNLYVSNFGLAYYVFANTGISLSGFRVNQETDYGITITHQPSFLNNNAALTFSYNRESEDRDFDSYTLSSNYYLAPVSLSSIVTASIGNLFHSQKPGTICKVGLTDLKMWHGSHFATKPSQIGFSVPP